MSAMSVKEVHSKIFNRCEDSNYDADKQRPFTASLSLETQPHYDFWSIIFGLPEIQSH